MATATVATNKWLGSVSVALLCLYVYVPSTLTYSLNIFEGKKNKKRGWVTIELFSICFLYCFVTLWPGLY